jgi:SAM-dependent methyltransferase
MKSSYHLEHRVLSLKGKEWQPLRRSERDRLVEECFVYWRKRGFPYYSLTDQEIEMEYFRVASAHKENILLKDEIRVSMAGVRLANLFHPQMWSVRVGSARTALESFNDDGKLRKLIVRSLNVWPDRYAVNESNVRQMLKTFSHTSCISNFRPTVAKAIYESYSSDGDMILDFSAGYGGRLLGCLPLDRTYLGVDPCAEQIKGLRAMLRKLRPIINPKSRVKLMQACAEDYLPKIATGSVALVFSSPPYFDNERYSNEPSQSYLRYPTYGEWLKHFLRPVIWHSARVLRPGGHMVINVSNVNGYKLTDDVMRLSHNKVALVATLKLRLINKPFLRGHEGKAYKHEPIFVFRKPSRRHG